ncbi:MAG: hypothetical protein JWN77_1734 [Frankiales bacterium]|jgi:hypothetical protein|nr:hypothetical protein [Frankiales bacterium]
MRKKLAVAALAGGLGLTGGMIIGPAVATAETGTATGVGGRLAAIKDALKGLVDDKTITQSQADAVAKTLDQRLPQRGPGRPGHFGGPRAGGAHLHPEDVAKALGVSVEELRTQTRAGKTLAQIATAKGISKATLVDRLVTAAKADIAEDVKAGRMTQVQADAVTEDLATRIGEKVDRVAPPRRGHHDDQEAPAAPGDAAPSGYRTA